MRLLSLSEASVQPRTSRLKLQRRVEVRVEGRRAADAELLPELGADARRRAAAVHNRPAWIGSEFGMRTTMRITLTETPRASEKKHTFCVAWRLATPCRKNFVN